MLDRQIRFALGHTGSIAKTKLSYKSRGKKPILEDMRLVLPPPKPCPECGSDPVYHKAEYVIHLVDMVTTPLFDLPLRTLSGITGQKKNRRYWGWYEHLERWGLGEFRDIPDDKTLLLCQVLWDEARARGIEMREFRFLGIPTNSFTARFPDGRHITFESIPFPPGTRQGVWWLDSKAVMKKKFVKLGIPVARGGSAFTLSGAKKIFNGIDKPVIVKPFEGSGSRHTTIHISTEAQLERAFAVSKQVSPNVIVEEELVGSVYRPTLVDGKLIATIRRDPPRVTGDGIHPISELIEIANKHPSRQGPYFSHIKMTPVGEAELKLQHMTLETVPEKGRVINLHQKINWSVGGTTTDVTDQVHPDNKALFEEIVRVLHAPIVGIDFIIEDISKSWKKQEKCGVIECNGRPFFDNHHLPFEGEPRNVAGVIWDMYTA